MNPFEKNASTRRQVVYEQGNPVTIKSDCKEGKFVPLGEKTEIYEPGSNNPKPNPKATESIKMQVLRWVNLSNCVLFPNENDEDAKAKTQTQVFYVDARGALCAMLLKGESRDRFLNVIRDIQLDSDSEKNVADVTITATMSRRISTKHNSKYYAVEFTYEPIGQDDYERNKAFYSEYGDKIVCARTLQEYIQRNVPNWNEYEYISLAAQQAARLGYVSDATAMALAEGDALATTPNHE